MTEHMDEYRGDLLSEGERWAEERIEELEKEVLRLTEELKHAKMYSTTDDVLEVRAELEKLREENELLIENSEYGPE